MKLLLVEDDRSIGSFLRRGIEAAGHLLDWTLEGRVAVEYASAFDYDSVILDLMLPDMDGLDVCAKLRQMCWDIPILILSARDQVPDRLKGFAAGADDFLVKPFAFDELFARLAAIQRRRAPAPREEKTLRAGSIVLDPESRTVFQADRAVEITSREFQLLEYLLKNKNKVVSRAAILNQVWGIDAEVCENSIDVYIGYLRKKLDLSGRLMTVRGIGFKLAVDTMRADRSDPTSRAGNRDSHP